VSQLILASASPRRRELLAALGIPFEVLPSRADEALPAGLPLRAAVAEVALRKAQEVTSRGESLRWVLGADTVVVLDDRVLGKPCHREEARAMLACLSGRTHRVVTGVALLGPGSREILSVETDVTFQHVTPVQIDWYTSLLEPYDKAGAYAIQGRGAFLVESIRGSYTNVVGLPMTETVRVLERAGLLSWKPEASRRDGL
jgi:septum formation protein